MATSFTKSVLSIEGEKLNWTVDEGRYLNSPITRTDSEGAVIDITGYTYFFTVKRNRNDSDANATILKTITSHTDPTNGITQITLLTSDTKGKAPGSYLYDYVECNTMDHRNTLFSGSFNIIQSIGDSVCA